MGLKKQATEDLGQLIDLNDNEKKKVLNVIHKEKHYLLVEIGV